MYHSFNSRSVSGNNFYKSDYHLAISQTATFLSIVQLYFGLYMNNRTWIKKKSKYNINLFLVKVVHCRLK